MLKLTPAFCAGIYLMLCEGPVFRRVRLPPPGGLAPMQGFVAFGVLKNTQDAGDYRYLGDDKHRIRLAQPYCATLEHAVETMAHEMIHLDQHIRNSITPRVVHNAEFKRISKRVCDAYGFPFSRFV